MTNMRISQLKRNDVASAISLYKQKVASNDVDRTLVSSLLRLQDDPDELLIAIEKVNKTI